MALSPATLAQLEQAASSAEATRDGLLTLRGERLAQVAEHDADLTHLRALHAQVLEHSTRITSLEAELSPITAPSNAQAPLFAGLAESLAKGAQALSEGAAWAREVIATETNLE